MTPQALSIGIYRAGILGTVLQAQLDSRDGSSTLTPAASRDQLPTRSSWPGLVLPACPPLCQSPSGAPGSSPCCLSMFVWWYRNTSGS